MKRLAKRVLPAPMWSAVQRVKVISQLALVEFRADQARYRRHGQRLESATITLTRTQLDGQLTRDYHRIEKGLALPSPRRPFGADIAERMDVLIPIAQRVAPDAAYLHAAVTARDALRRWNERGEIDDEVAPVAPPTTHAADLALAFESRHSVRNFSAEPVSKADLDEAIRIAAYSPSVCNREPWQVRLYEGSDVQRMLKYQNGNRGFADTVPVLALVSVELGHFEGVGERNQAWIEGGVFSSTLVWVLHTLGLGSCMLNLSLPTNQADALRAAADMPASEIPIMMIAIGHPTDGHRFARSPRRTTDELIVRP